MVLSSWPAAALPPTAAPAEDCRPGAGWGRSWESEWAPSTRPYRQRVGMSENDSTCFRQSLQDRKWRVEVITWATFQFEAGLSASTPSSAAPRCGTRGCVGHGKPEPSHIPRMTETPLADAGQT